MTMVDAKFFNPDKTEDQFDIHIDYGGRWHHQGSPITRDALSKLFSSVLHFDPETDEYWLITPHEQGRISVDDAPYVVTDYDFDGKNIVLRTNLGHSINADKNHPVTCRADTGIPYIITANNVPARINRNVRNHLVRIALDQGGYDQATGTLTLTCNNTRHIIALETDKDHDSDT